MSSLAIAILAIAGLFGLLVAVKRLSGKLKYCAVCLAVSLTWLSLLILLWIDVFEDQAIVAVLLGQSSLGVYYLLERHAPKELLVLRLPVLLSLTMVAYVLVSGALHIDELLILAGIWTAFGLIYVYRTNEYVRDKAKALIECCSDW